MNHAAKLLLEQGIYYGTRVKVHCAVIDHDYDAVVTDLSSHFDMGVEIPDIRVRYRTGMDEWVRLDEIAEVQA